MIRDAHDFRAGIHDGLLRKLTGRSYSSLVHPIVRDFPAETMPPGDVFFDNDVCSCEGGIGHLPDLCVSVPVLHYPGEPAARALAQVVLRWHIDRGDIAFSKSVNPARIREECDSFDLEPSGDDVAAISALNKDQRTDPGTFPG